MPALVVAAVRGYAGQLSDRPGRPPVAAAGMTLAAGSPGALALRGGTPTLVVTGALYSLGFGAARPALTAWAVDLVLPTERGKAMGTYDTALELGSAAGATGFGVAVSRSSFPAMFAVACALALLGGALGAARRVKEGRR